MKRNGSHDITLYSTHYTTVYVNYLLLTGLLPSSIILSFTIIIVYTFFKLANLCRLKNVLYTISPLMTYFEFLQHIQ